jgi:hypothetical protein
MHYFGKFLIWRRKPRQAVNLWREMHWKTVVHDFGIHDISPSAFP